jgi:hypothetical protein
MENLRIGETNGNAYGQYRRTKAEAIEVEGPGRGTSTGQYRRTKAESWVNLGGILVNLGSILVNLGSQYIQRAPTQTLKSIKHESVARMFSMFCVFMSFLMV